MDWLGFLETLPLVLAAYLLLNLAYPGVKFVRMFCYPRATDRLNQGRRMGRRGRVLLVIGGIIAAFLAYEISTYFVAYSDDAYVRTDLVAVAPEVTGPIIALYVHDNQPVRKGDPFFTIDPVPFRLDVDQHQAEIREAKAQITADEHAVAVAQDRLQAANSALAFARATQSRYASLNNSGFIPRQSLDRVTNDLHGASDTLAAAQAPSPRPVRSRRCMKVLSPLPRPRWGRPSGAFPGPR
jgi:multidrug resistance efflux pump